MESNTGSTVQQNNAGPDDVIRPMDAGPDDVIRPMTVTASSPGTLPIGLRIQVGIHQYRIGVLTITITADENSIVTRPAPFMAGTHGIGVWVTPQN